MVQTSFRFCSSSWTGEKLSEAQAEADIRLFGLTSVRCRTAPLALPKMRKTRALLAVLAARAPEPVLRGHVRELIWNRRDQQQAQASLRQALHELNETFGSEGRELLLIDRTYIGLDTERVWVDVAELKRATPERPNALDLYRPRLAEDLYGIDATFDRWLEAEERGLFLLARKLAVATLSAAEPGSVTIAAERLLAIDPAHEEGWRALMQSHARAGDRTAAMHAFARCRLALAEHAGLAPSNDTIDLADKLRCDNRRSATTVETAPPYVKNLAPSRERLAKKRTRIGIMRPRALADGRGAELALGLAEEMITQLAPFSWLACVAGPWLAAVACQPRDSGPEWNTLDLDFLFECTIQQDSNGLRVMASVVDRRLADVVAWARSFDCSNEDILNMQEEVASAIVAQIVPELLVRGLRARSNDGCAELCLEDQVRE